MGKMSSPKLTTIKRLFAVSGNQCAFTSCLLPVSENSGTVTGEVAHIKASSVKGPRYDANQTEEERNNYKNLILLCSRHHTIIDSEVEKYTVGILTKMKKEHEIEGVVEITPFTTAVSQTLLNNYQNTVINHNSGQVVVNSPGATQAGTINNFNTTKPPKITIPPPNGTVSSDLLMNSYIVYLIEKYQDHQKQDKEKKGDRKYQLIYSAIKREFKSKWQLVPLNNYQALETFLNKRLLNTKVGRIRNNRGQKIFHSLEEHREKINA
jgi:hypothetical protein